MVLSTLCGFSGFSGFSATAFHGPARQACLGRNWCTCVKHTAPFTLRRRWREISETKTPHHGRSYFSVNNGDGELTLVTACHTVHGRRAAHRRDPLVPARPSPTSACLTCWQVDLKLVLLGASARLCRTPTPGASLDPPPRVIRRPAWCWQDLPGLPLPVQHLRRDHIGDSLPAPLTGGTSR